MYAVGIEGLKPLSYLLLGGLQGTRKAKESC